MPLPRTTADRARRLVLGMRQFWEERSRIPQDAAIGLTAIDLVTTVEASIHGEQVKEVAEFFSFVPVNLKRTTATPENLSGIVNALPSNTHVVSVSLNDLVLSRLPANTINNKDIVWVNSAGNDSGLPTDADFLPSSFTNPTSLERYQNFVAHVNTGLVLHVGGADVGFVGRNELHFLSSRCGSLHGNTKLRFYCVLAPFAVPTSQGFFVGTSAATPVVAGILASARALWPGMTSRQTVQLAQFCARPINADGTFGNWGTILTEETASDIWGQGVLSVECVYDSSGALVNPITNTRLVGTMILQGTTSQLRLTDQFGRDTLFSRTQGAALVPVLPDHHAGFFATKEGVLGFMWSEHIALAFSQEENGFFGSYGTGDFAFGDTYAIIARLGHQWAVNKKFDIGFHVQSIYGQMTPAGSSIVRKAEGHTHQFTAKLDYHAGGLNASISLTHALGIRGKIDINSMDDLALKPRPVTTARFAASIAF